MAENKNDWKLKLRYGKVKTEYRHFTAIANGVAGELAEGYECRPGRAWMTMKTWATDSSESADMIKVMGEQIGFIVDGRIHIYDSKPSEPPAENPFGYDISFTPYDENV